MALTLWMPFSQGGFAGIAFAGLNDFAVVGAQVVPVLAAALEYLEGCHGEKQ